MKLSGPIKVLIVDDSPLVRSILTRVLGGHKDIEIVGGAKDPYEARELIINFRPDVIILDIEMPRMNGLTFLRKLMAHYPVPVIMCSGIARSSSAAALEAIEAGAVDVVAKPTVGGSKALAGLGEELAEKIRAAVIAMPARPRIPATATGKPSSFRTAGLDPNQYLIAIGASTGGTEAIKTMLERMPADSPPVVMVQHMPEGFTLSYAGRLNQFSPLAVKEAEDGDRLDVGKAFLARGGTQMRIQASGGRYHIAFGGNEPVNRHCPSVDVLFDSVVPFARRSVGVLLTGMGADGAQGLLTLRRNGATTIGQDPKSCVVYGMPKVAADIGAVQKQASPAEIPNLIIQMLRARKTATVTAR